MPEMMAMPSSFLTSKNSKQRLETNKEKPNYYQGIVDDFLRAIYNSVHSKSSSLDQYTDIVTLL